MAAVEIRCSVVIFMINDMNKNTAGLSLAQGQSKHNEVHLICSLIHVSIGSNAEFGLFFFNII